ncbi:MAG: hypothetical protein IMF06_01385 [Proteobacteria bacterium]|nr:hypothetical protein [Pseudomonadota bacterium]
MATITALISALFLVSACESYDFTVNDKLVYTPKPLFSDFDTPDAALYECIKQGIIDAKITSASQLTSLNCSHAGIESLQGLSVFNGLSHLKLSSNKIRNLAEVAGISTLEELYLDDNVVVDPVPLYQLPALRLLDLTHNTTLQCPESSEFPVIESLQLPKHCG